MKETRSQMGMTVVVEVLDEQVLAEDLNQVFDYFHRIDEKFSTYKPESEISRINRGQISADAYSEEMKEVFRLAEETKKQTNGYFDIRTPQGQIDPSGLVKGWAIYNAALILKHAGFKNFFIDAGGDVQPSGHNREGKDWRVGIKNPFHEQEIVKVVYLRDQGIATSGTYIRGAHIYDPRSRKPPEGFVSLTVIGPNVYEADRFATAAFAMGTRGIQFIEEMAGFEGYAINAHGVATATSGFLEYTKDR